MSFAVVMYSLIGIVFAVASAGLCIYSLSLYEAVSSDQLASRIVIASFVIAMLMFFGSSAAYLVPSPSPEQVLARVMIFRFPLLAACAVLFWLLRYVERSSPQKTQRGSP